MANNEIMLIKTAMTRVWPREKMIIYKYKLLSSTD